NAFITRAGAGAMKAAEAFDAGRKKGSCKPLGGVPIVIKDNIEVAGLPASAGTPALKGFVPRKDAPVAAKLRAAGAIIIGKTNMHELAFGISGYNGGFKTGPEPGVRNAYDATKIAGGSSSGTGAAIGSRIVTAGLGTDTGGSVRVPCALNGCFPLALYEAYDDMVAYLKKSGTGVTIEDLAKSIASPDVKGTYDGLVIPRKLPGPNNTVVDAKPAYDEAMKTARPALQALYKDTF